MKFKVVKRCQEDLSSLHGLLKSFLPFARKRMGFNKPPTIFFQSDDANAKRLLGKTAHYEPSTMNITVYVTGRHPKDVLRSLSHELVHHGQNCRGEFGHVPETAPGYAQTDDHMRSMEEEAYRDGNLCFRDWEDGVKTNKIRIAKPLMESLLKEEAAEEAAEEEEAYTVKDGDTLSGIAGEMYGDVHKWPIIYLANKEQIGEDPDLISPGMAFVIPDVSEFSKLSQDEINSIYALSSFYEKSGDTMAPVSAGAQEITPQAVYASGVFVFPLEGSPPISSRFGMRDLSRNKKLVAQNPERYGKPHHHGGVDFSVREGTPVYAPYDGVIVRAGYNKGKGNFITFKTDKVDDIPHIWHSFLHLRDNMRGTKGKRYKKGDILTYTGGTGWGTGNHLHWEVRVKSLLARRTDPLELYSTVEENISLREWKNQELNRLLLEKFNLGVNKK